MDRDEHRRADSTAQPRPEPDLECTTDGRVDEVELTLELWIRASGSTVPCPKRDRAIDRVDHLAARGVVDEVTVNDWVDSIDRRPHSPQNHSVLATLDAFEQWADRTDRTLEPCFRTRAVESTITGESTVVCRPPTLALAEYHDGELVHVAPSRAGDRLIEVEERLDALTRGDLPEPTASSDDSREVTGAGGERRDDDARDRPTPEQPRLNPT